MQDDPDLRLPDAQPTESSEEGSGGSDHIEEDEEQVSRHGHCDKLLHLMCYVSSISTLRSGTTWRSTACLAIQLTVSFRIVYGCVAQVCQYEDQNQTACSYCTACTLCRTGIGQ